ncbi:MAG: acetylornithine deacetylase [Kangiellaceae bacterium]
MNYEYSSVFKHLEKLVSFDTQNPPRKINKESDVFKYLCSQLTDFETTFIDAGDGCLSLLAKRGSPDILFNFHIDTVPIAEGWTSNPHQLIQQDNKLVALGACDIKGASACMLSAVNQAKGDIALLFSSDEEHGSSEAIKKFLTTEHGFKKAIVAEPTLAKAVTAHRGIQTAIASFTGIPGHASEARAYKDNAIHKAGEWISAAINWVGSQTQQVQNLSGLPFNIGTIEGGIKANMIASNCELKFGFRPLPGQSSKDVLSTLTQLENDQSGVKITSGFFGPCLPAANQNFEDSIIKAKQLASQLEIEEGDAVSFWTEASLFSQAGLTTFVFGPGDIAQAHTANEWVDISQLEKVEQIYINYLSQTK